MTATQASIEIHALAMADLVRVRVERDAWKRRAEKAEYALNAFMHKSRTCCWIGGDGMCCKPVSRNGEQIGYSHLYESTETPRFLVNNQTKSP